MSSFSEPRPIDLKTASPDQLDSLFSSYDESGRSDEQVNVVREKWRRGIARSKDYFVLNWNPERVTTVLAPFVEISQQVPENLRTAFSTAGGGVFKPKGHPDARWIDSYTAVKTDAFNAAFACHVREPGDDPVFILNIQSSESIQEFSYPELDSALARWKEIVASVLDGSRVA